MTSGSAAPHVPSLTAPRTFDLIDVEPPRVLFFAETQESDSESIVPSMAEKFECVSYVMVSLWGLLFLWLGH